MRPVTMLVPALVLTAVAGCTSGPDAPPGAGRFSVRYADAKGSLADTAARVEQSEVVDDAVAAANRRVAMSADVVVTVRSCTSGTGYDPDERRIDICLQDVEETRGLLGDNDAENVDRTERGILEETVLHEAGHAALDVLDLKFTGREEDVADQFSAFLLVEDGDDGLDALEDAAYGYEISASAYEAEDADEHSSDAQRAINLQCWVLGSDERDSDYLISPKGLTEERAEFCPEEWQDLRDGWEFLLDEAGALRG